MCSDFERPHADIPIHMHSKCNVSELGERGDAEDSKRAHGLELTTNELEPLGVLVLDLMSPVANTDESASFSSMQTYPIFKPMRKHTQCGVRENADCFMCENVTLPPCHLATILC